MPSNTEDVTMRDTGLKHEEGAPQKKSEEGKPTYKSFKKKFRKMRIQFEEKMRQSNDWYMREQKAEEQIKRLAQENDQLLDLLLDVNNSAQIPPEKRIDMSVEVPSLSALPPLINNEDITKASELSNPAGQALYKEIHIMLDEKVSVAAASVNGFKPQKPFSLLMATVPHLSLSNPLVPQEVRNNLETPEGHSGPLTYLTADQIDDYLFDIDASLGNAHPPPHPHASPTQQDLALRNPNSVYNWLRKNEPKVFLQDNEGSEKSLGKPGALRGAGKRASIPAPSKPDTLEFVEEDGLTYDPSLSGALAAVKGKRKREEGDDGAYHPKSGKVDDSGTKPRTKRPYNRKKKPETEEGAATPTPAEKVKGGRKKKAKVPSPDSHAHPV